MVPTRPVFAWPYESVLVPRDYLEFKIQVCICVGSSIGFTREAPQLLEGDSRWGRTPVSGTSIQMLRILYFSMPYGMVSLKSIARMNSSLRLTKSCFDSKHEILDSGRYSP
jgi:hypothetical protein